jgi:hypothetical protein
MNELPAAAQRQLLEIVRQRERAMPPICGSSPASRRGATTGSRAGPAR